MRALYEMAGVGIVLAVLGCTSAACALESGGLERRRGEMDGGAGADAGGWADDGGTRPVDARVMGVDAGPGIDGGPGVDAGSPPREDAGVPPMPDAGRPPRPDAGPSCPSVAGTWTVGGSCGPDACVVSQAGCNVTVACGGFTETAMLMGDTLTFSTPDGSCTLRFSATRATGACTVAWGDCTIDAMRVGP